MRPVLLACLLVACRPDRGDAPAETDAPVALGACEAPVGLADDPLAVTASLDLNDVTEGGQTHVVRIAVDEAGSILYGGGFGGVYAVDVSGDAPVLAGEMIDVKEPFHLALRDPTTLVVSNRNVGWAVVDVADPAAMRRIAGVPGPGFGPLAFAGDTLLIAQGTVLHAVDLSDRTAPARLGGVDALGLPVGVVVSGDRAYVADAEAGLVVVDVADPSAPRRVGAVETAGTPQAIALGDGFVAVASGAAGVELFDLADPDVPASVAQVVTGGPAVGVHARDAVLAVAAHDGLTLVDVSEPSAPEVIGFEATAQWGMAPYVLADRALLAEWNLVDVVAFDPADRAPQVDATPSAVYCPSEAESVVVHNRGGSDLRLVGASVDDPRFTFTAAAEVVPPGGSVALDVAFADDGAPADASLCLATDDPDEPVVQVALTSVAESLGAALCGTAPDFSLPDLGGVTRSLVEERGIPVLILFFSTW